MANTKKLVNTLASGNTAVVYLTLSSDGTQETNYVVYDSSVIAGLLGIQDPLTCTIRTIRACSNSAAGVIKLNWDATTPVVALCLPYGGSSALNHTFCNIGGLKNQGGTGVTGDITLTTTGLASGDAIFIVMEVRAN